MAKIYGIVSTKGGVGKTSFSAQFGGILADMGQKVLLVDADFQQSLSLYYTLQQQAPHGLRQLITTANPDNCISHTDIKNLDIIISDDPDQKLLDWLRESINHPFYLSAALKKIKNYDYVIIDSQGARGLLQESIILACDELISPIVPEFLDSQEFVRGTVAMLQNLEPADGIGIPMMPNIPNLTGLIYRQDRTNDSCAIASVLRKKFHHASDGKIRILKAYIPTMSCYKKAAARHLPVHRIETRRRNSPTPSAHAAYLSVVHELLPHLSDVLPSWTNGELK